MSPCGDVWAGLDRDWQSLCAEVQARPVPTAWLAELPAWALPPTTQAAHWLADLCDLVGRNDDVTTAALIRLAQAGDQVAGRVVVQAMLPRLWSLCRRDHRHNLTDYISVAWLRLMSFPARQRGRAMMVNLCLDCLKWLSREAARQQPEVVLAGLGEPGAELPLHQQIPPWGNNNNSVMATARYANELLQLVGRNKLVSAICLGVLRSVYLDGLSGKEAAVRHGISHDMVRYYCSSAIKILRARRQELIEALGDE